MTEKSRWWSLRPGKYYTIPRSTIAGSARCFTRRSFSFQVLTIGKLHVRCDCLVVLNKRDRTVRVYDASTGTASGEAWTTGQIGYVVAIAITPDNKILAAGSDDWTIVLFDMDKRTTINNPIRGHSGVSASKISCLARAQAFCSQSDP